MRRRHQRDGDLPEPQADRRAVLTLILLHLPYNANNCCPLLCFCFLRIAMLLRHLLSSLITPLLSDSRGFFFFTVVSIKWQISVFLCSELKVVVDQELTLEAEICECESQRATYICGWIVFFFVSVMLIYVLICG